MAEPSVEVGETIEKNDDKSTAQGKDTEDTSKNDALSKSENDSNTSESAVKNSEAKKPSNVATNIEGAENGANYRNTDEVKENSQSENLKEETNVNQETQKASNDLSKDSKDNAMTMAAVEASSTEFKSREKAGNQDSVEQTRDTLSQNSASVDNKDTEKNLGKENAELATEAASMHDKTLTGDELKEETIKDVTSNDENGTGNNIVETDAFQDINNGENKDSGKMEKPEPPVDIQSEVTTNEVAVENVDVATDKEDNTVKSDIKPTNEIFGEQANISDEVESTETKHKDGDAQKTSGENGESKDEVGIPIEINTQQSKEDSEHGSVDAGKIDTQGDSGIPSKPTEQSEITEGKSNEDESTKSNEPPSSTEQAVPENQSRTATKIENAIPSENVEDEVITNKDSGKAEEELSSNVKEKSEGDYNISEVTAKLEQSDAGTKAEKNEEKYNGLENVETKGNAEKSEKEDSGNKNETSKGSTAESEEDVENSGIKQDSQEDDGVSKDTGNESEVTKDQEDQNLESKQQENKVNEENTDDKPEGETGDRVSESKEASDVKDVAESDKKSEISSEKIEGDMITDNDGRDEKTAGAGSMTEAPADVESIDRIMKVEKNEGVKAEKPKEASSGDQKQTTEGSDIIAEDKDTQQGTEKEGEVSKVPNNEPEVTKDVENQTLESKNKTEAIEQENAGYKKPEGETKDNAIEPEGASDIKNSEEMVEKSKKEAINKSTKAEVTTITPTTTGTGHETVEEKVNETTCATKETSAENAETEIKDKNYHASTILNESATESGESEQPKPQDSEESETVEETVTSVKDEGQVQITTEETISDTAGEEENNPEQNVVTVPENNKDDVHQVKAEDADQPRQVWKNASDIQTDQETKNLGDKIADSGSEEGFIASKTLIDQKDKSLPDTHAQKEFESKDEINDAEKSEESKDESESTKPTVDQDDTEETSPQGSTDDHKIVESKDQTNVSETTVKSVDQTNDDAPAESNAQEYEENDVETETKVDQDSHKQTTTETNDERNKAVISGLSEDKNADTQEVLSGVTGGSSEVSEDKNADTQEVLSGVTGGSSEVAEDKNTDTEGVPESKEKVPEKQTDQNHEKTTIQSKDDGLYSEKSTKANDGVLSATEAKDLGIDSGTIEGTKEEKVNSATVKESEDLDADNKKNIEIDESSDATVTTESKDSGKTAEAKEEPGIKMDQDVDKETAIETNDKTNKTEIGGVSDDKNAGVQEVLESKEKSLEIQTECKDQNLEETPVQSKDDSLDSGKLTKVSNEVLSGTEAKDLGIDTGTEAERKEEKVNSATVKESDDVNADNKTVTAVTANSKDSETAAESKEEPESKVDQDVDKDRTTETNDERNEAEIIGVSDVENAGTQEIVESQEKTLEIQTECKDQAHDEITIQSKNDNLDSEKSTKVNDEILSTTEAKDSAFDTGTTAELIEDDSSTVKESEDLDAENRTNIKVDKSSDATVTAESKDQSIDAVSAPDSKDESEIIIEETELVKEKISVDKTKDSTETSTVVPTERPKQSSEARKLKDKQSTFGNTEDLALLGVSMETKKETKTELKKVKSRNKCVDVEEKDKDVPTKAQDVPHTVEVTKDLKTLEKPTKAAENQKVNDGKEVGDYVLVERENIKAKESNANDVHQQNSIGQDDNTGKDDCEKTEEEYVADFCENDEDHDDVREEERPGEEEAKASHVETETRNVTAERPVIEITAEFLELMEGFCMAASQEFPSSIVDFACRYFTRIYRRRKALRKYSIEVSDLAMLSDVNWCGNI